MLKYRTNLAKIPSYTTSETEWKIKVDANEMNLNLPPMVEDRVMGRLSRIAFNRYPSVEELDLAEQIADNFSLQAENIILGNGSSEILEKLFFCFGGKTRKIVYPTPSFSMYEIYAKLSDSTGVAVSLEEDFSLDVEKFVTAVLENKASLAVLCTPNNPTGNAIPLRDIEYIAQNISCAFVVDEAYVEFHGVSAASLMAQYPHLMIARTFSKAYGLAAARVGYLLADAAVRKQLSAAFMPYHMNVLSLAVADIVYQTRDEFVPRIQMVVAERKRIQEALQKMKGLTVYPSETNFILCQHERAKALQAYLAKSGIGVRSFPENERLQNFLRISIGTREENDAWVKAIQTFIEGRD